MHLRGYVFYVDAGALQIRADLSRPALDRRQHMRSRLVFGELLGVFGGGLAQLRAALKTLHVAITPIIDSTLISANVKIEPKRIRRNKRRRMSTLPRPTKTSFMTAISLRIQFSILKKSMNRVTSKICLTSGRTLRNFIEPCLFIFF